MDTSEMLAAINASLGTGGPCGREIGQSPAQPGVPAEPRAANDVLGPHGPDLPACTWPAQTRASTGSVQIVHQVHLKTERATQPPPTAVSLGSPGSVRCPCGQVDYVDAGQFEPGVGARELLGLFDLLGPVDVANLTIAAGSAWSLGQVWGEVRHLVRLGLVRRRGRHFELTLTADSSGDRNRTVTRQTCADRVPTELVKRPESHVG